LAFNRRKKLSHGVATFETRAIEKRAYAIDISGGGAGHPTLQARER